MSRSVTLDEIDFSSLKNGSPTKPSVKTTTENRLPIEMDIIALFEAESMDILRIAQTEINNGKEMRTHSSIFMKECLQNAKNANSFVEDEFANLLSDAKTSVVINISFFI